MIKHNEFWNGRRGLENIKPKRTGSNWESFDAPAVVHDLCGDTYTVNDIGCGTGRMASVFSQKQYAGYDLNPDAIEIAEREFPGHLFEVVDDYADIEPADTLLFHSSALHIPDEELVTLFKLARHRIVIAETMLGHTSRKPNPKAGLATHYTRAPFDYEALLPEWINQRTQKHIDNHSRKVFTYLVFEK